MWVILNIHGIKWPHKALPIMNIEANNISRTAHVKICNLAGVPSNYSLPRMPQTYAIQAKWVRDMYVQDAQARRERVTRELESETGSEILSFDWTVDAAKRCGRPFLFNAMSSDRSILLSILTRTSAPFEIVSAVEGLKRRGANPKVVYVDDHCCGAWPSLLQKIWPGVAVRLDAMHAMRRLTQTTSSTRHPWHAEFCSLLSSAIYTFDDGEHRRFKTAWRSAGNISDAPKHVEKKYVPRVVANSAHIVSAIGSVINMYSCKKHADSGELLTPATHRAWDSLRVHVLAGCLCDPLGVQLNTYGVEESVGGGLFRAINSMRGSSALEGFHTHQKQWLGLLANHGNEAGAALLRDGAVRWNRNRRSSVNPVSLDSHWIFDGDVMTDA